MAKWNEGLRIEESLAPARAYPQRGIFAWLER